MHNLMSPFFNWLSISGKTTTLFFLYIEKYYYFSLPEH